MNPAGIHINKLFRCRFVLSRKPYKLQVWTFGPCVTIHLIIQIQRPGVSPSTQESYLSDFKNDITLGTFLGSKLSSWYNLFQRPFHHKPPWYSVEVWVVRTSDIIHTPVNELRDFAVYKDSIKWQKKKPSNLTAPCLSAECMFLALIGSERKLTWIQKSRY